MAELPLMSSNLSSMVSSDISPSDPSDLPWRFADTLRRSRAFNDIMDANQSTNRTNAELANRGFDIDMAKAGLNAAVDTRDVNANPMALIGRLLGSGFEKLVGTPAQAQTDALAMKQRQANVLESAGAGVNSAMEGGEDVNSEDFQDVIGMGSTAVAPTSVQAAGAREKSETNKAQFFLPPRVAGQPSLNITRDLNDPATRDLIAQGYDVPPGLLGGVVPTLSANPPPTAGNAKPAGNKPAQVTNAGVVAKGLSQLKQRYPGSTSRVIGRTPDGGYFIRVINPVTKQSTRRQIDAQGNLVPEGGE